MQKGPRKIEKASRDVFLFQGPSSPLLHRHDPFRGEPL